MQHTHLAAIPGYRRRFRITPAPGRVGSELEDDYHCMSVIVHHDGEIATAIDAVMARAPWTTCPGAVAKVRETFTGVALDAFAERGEKRTNCTHLYDLAILAAAHAGDDEPLVYDVLVSDPVEGSRRAELWRNGTEVLGWTEHGGRIVEPAELGGLGLDKLGPWISSLDAPRQEAARVLRWGAMVARGRTLPMEKQSDATRMSLNCFTFQPQVVVNARRVGLIRDFSSGTAQPLDNGVVA